MRKEIGQKDLILNRYGDRVRAAQEKNVDLFHTTGWVDETAVKKHGDAVIVRTMSIEAGPEPVPAIWALSYRNSSAHLEQRVKEKVRVEARFAPEEDENSGTEIVTAISWEGDRALRVFFFFDRDLAPNSTTRIRLTIKWPKYGADMLDGQVEPNYWTFRRQTTGFNSLVIYESEFAPKGVRITPLDGSPRPDVDRQKASGSTLVRFALADIKVGQEYGYRSELIR
ncbi:MAG: hypothetical protein KF680_10020 [Cryobacterium sp.]|nr:hypothetical protein [Cryobacterium sp.]